MSEIFRYSHMRYETPSQDDYYPHTHNNYELFFFLEGEAEYVIGSSLYHLEKHDLLIIKPMTYHHLHLLSDQPYERTHFNFVETEILDNVRPFLKNAYPIYHIPQDSPIMTVFEDLLKNQETFTETEFYYFKRTALNLILIYLQHLSPYIVPKKATKSTNFDNNGTLKNIIQYIDDNSEKGLTVNDLAAKFFISSSWIIHTFKKTMHISFTQYVNRRRILYAQRLILSGISAHKAAELCNYENYATFFRQYKKYLGHSPLDDRPKDAEKHKKKERNTEKSPHA